MDNCRANREKIDKKSGWGTEDEEEHCGLRSADCGLKGKNPNSRAGGGRNPWDATVARLAGGLVRRAPLERPTAGNRESETRQRRAGREPAFVPASRNYGGQAGEPGTGNRRPGFVARGSSLVACKPLIQPPRSCE